MRKTKTEKGITLVALIITIVALLILALVAVNQVTNDGVVDESKNIAQKWNEKQDVKNQSLSELNKHLNDYNISSGNTVEDDTSTCTHTATTFIHTSVDSEVHKTTQHCIAGIGCGKLLSTNYYKHTFEGNTCKYCGYNANS